MPGALAHEPRVGLDIAKTIERQTEQCCGDLRIAGLVALAVRLGAEHQPDLAVGAEADFRTFVRGALGHGHYEPPANRANPLRPSWVFGDEEIAATAADYLALGHWDRPMQVGDGRVPAYYSGSPALARTVNLVRLSTTGGVVVSREALRR